MTRRMRALLAFVVVTALMLSSALVAAGHPGQHGEIGGHLSGKGEWGKIDLVDQLMVSDAEDDLIADVAVSPDGNYRLPGPLGWGRVRRPGGERPGRRRLHHRHLQLAEPERGRLHPHAPGHAGG